MTARRMAGKEKVMRRLIVLTCCLALALPGCLPIVPIVAAIHTAGSLARQAAALINATADGIDVVGASNIT